jgi:cell filamentation protein
MELSILDPFGDYQAQGYLRNLFKEKDLTIVGHLDTAAFEDHSHEAMRALRRLPIITYKTVTSIHKLLFESVYPWAGTDRSENAPTIAIAKGGYNNLFAHPADVERAATHALMLASDAQYLREHPGVVFGYFAHAHPFLEGNGRTILTVYAELCRRAGFHIDWEAIEKKPFLDALTQELLKPESSMDMLLAPFVRSGALSLKSAAIQLQVNFNPKV